MFMTCYANAIRMLFQNTVYRRAEIFIYRMTQVLYISEDTAADRINRSNNRQGNPKLAVHFSEWKNMLLDSIVSTMSSIGNKRMMAGENEELAPVSVNDVLDSR